MKNRKYLKYSIIIIIWLAVWEIVSLFVNNKILMVGPFQVAVSLFEKLGSLDFYISVISSLLKISLGFITGLIIGMTLAVISWKNQLFNDFLKPFMSFINSVPVASFVVLFLIWWHSNVLSIAVCICIVMPQIYINMLSGLNSTDVKLEQMAKVMSLSRLDKIHYIYRPAVMNYLTGAIKVAAGLAWKSSVAAEVIATSDYSIGNELYLSKIYLDTAGVLAYTIVIIVLSYIFEKLLLKLVRYYSRYPFKCRGALGNNSNRAIDKLVIDGISKSFGEKQVLDNYSAVYEKYERSDESEINFRNILDWPSGSGKTTLFKIIAGIERADSGSINPKNYNLTMLFQEDRLIEGFSAVKNVELVSGDTNKAIRLLNRLLPDADINMDVERLSGGQKRRVALARTLMKDAELIILDEPYEGLDENSRILASNVISEYAVNKVILIASHV